VYRFAKKGEQTKFSKLAMKFSPLAGFFQDGIFDYEKLHEFLAEKVLAKAGATLVDVHNCPTAKSQDGLIRWMRLWGVRSKKFGVTAISDASGNIPDSAQGSVNNLINHWAPVFSSNEFSLEAAQFFVRQVNYTPLPLSWVCDKDRFLKIFLSRRVSAPGPDGLSHSFWAAAPPAFQDVLFNLYLHLLNLGSLPDGFNHALFVFIPKAEQDEDCPHYLIRTASAMRPLSLSNADAKLIAAAISSPLQDFAAINIHPHQRGGIRGRQLVDNIIDVEAASLFALNSSTPDLLPSLVFYDFAAAFPSVMRQFLFFIMVHADIPAFIIWAVMQLHNDSQHSIVFAGQIFAGLPVNSGIKQGCCLPGYFLP
jgi:hypothetical protein